MTTQTKEGMEALRARAVLRYLQREGYLPHEKKGRSRCKIDLDALSRIDPVGVERFGREFDEYHVRTGQEGHGIAREADGHVELRGMVGRGGEFDADIRIVTRFTEDGEPYMEVRAFDKVRGGCQVSYPIGQITAEGFEPVEAQSKGRYGSDFERERSFRAKAIIEKLQDVGWMGPSNGHACSLDVEQMVRLDMDGFADYLEVREAWDDQIRDRAKEHEEAYVEEDFSGEVDEVCEEHEPEEEVQPDVGPQKKVDARVEVRYHLGQPPRLAVVVETEGFGELDAHGFQEVGFVIDGKLKIHDDVDSSVAADVAAELTRTGRLGEEVEGGYEMTAEHLITMDSAGVASAEEEGIRYRERVEKALTELYGAAPSRSKNKSPDEIAQDAANYIDSNGPSADRGQGRQRR
jgi:hypothetical protein